MKNLIVAGSLLLLASCQSVHTSLDVQTREKNIESDKMVHYKDFGAKGDGATDDMAAIVKAHAYANEHGLPVRADDHATYYIGGKDATAVIQTDTDFGTARFIIDDRTLENRSAWVFSVKSKMSSFKPDGISALKKSQRKINADFPGRCVVRVTNSHVKNYIRKGSNKNNGSSLTDVFMVDADGNIDMSAPILWDFEQVTDIIAVPIDTTPLTIHGGQFTTIANQEESKYLYHSRGFQISRSNVHIAGLEHLIKGEGDHGAPYRGFIHINTCADVTVKNSMFTAHKTYRTIGNAGRPVSMGTYDLHATRAVDVSFINCRQSNDIKDRRFWGIMASNYSKNLLYDGCTLSRFDAHKGVCNATIRNSTIGHAGINAIGHGLLTVENSTVYGRHLINMRRDYGSTWNGEFVIRNCVFVPACGGRVNASLIGGNNTGDHDFGYTCYMPARITLETLRIDDSDHPDDYRGPTIFSNFNPNLRDADYVEKYPIVRPKEVILDDIHVVSDLSLHLSDNPRMFKDVKVLRD